jgi:predicted phage-related endonuclease
MNAYHKIKDFHGARKLGCGASDIPTLAGLNKRYGQTPLTLWQEKRGLAPSFEGNERTEWGNDLEPMVLRKFIANRYGQDAADDFLAQAIRGRSSGPFKRKTEAVHPERKYCLSHADLLVDWGKELELCPPEQQEHPYLVEAKTSGLYSAKRREGVAFEGYDPDDRSQFGIPDKVFMQVQWQLFTYGVTEAWVVVLIDTADYREYGPIVYDPRHVEKSIAMVEKFWALVESGTEPTPATWGDVVSIYPDLVDLTAMVSGEAEMEARRMIAEGRELKERVKALEEKLDDIKMGLGILAGDTKAEDGTVKRTMNRVLNDSEGKKLATFRDQTKDSISLPMADIRKKQAKSVELTENEKRVVAVDAELRALGCYKTSDPYRVVTY